MNGRKSFVPLLSAVMVAAAISAVAADVVDHHGNAVAVAADYYECLSCHDGMVATSVAYCSGNCDFKNSHSILRSYPPPGKEREYAPVAQVEAAGIKFLHGRIACISCHNIERRDRYHLVVDMAGSRLCFTCHRI